MLDNQLNDSAQVNSGREFDFRDNPWTSVDAALKGITGVHRVKGRKPVPVQAGATYGLWWWKDGVRDEDFIPYDPRIGLEDALLFAGATVDEVSSTIALNGTKWRISDIIFLLSFLITYPIDPADETGLMRIDNIVADYNGQTIYQKGTASESAVAPEVPYKHILVTTLYVDLDGVTVVEPPIDTGKYVRSVNDILPDVNGNVAIEAGGGSSTFAELTDSPYDNALLATALNDLDADIVTAQDTANIAQDGVDALELGKVDKVAGKSLLSDTEIARLLTLDDIEAYSFAVSDETSTLTAGVAKISFRMPYAFTLTSIRASLNEAATGSTFIVNIKQNGTTIFSTNLTIDATELTSTTAAVPNVISNFNLLDDALITVDIVQVGGTNAGKGLKISFIGFKP